MAPSILPGDSISIRKASLEEIVPGEVILFVQRGRWFLHRVVKRNISISEHGVEEPALITRGDRLAQNDPPVFSAELLGRAVSLQRGDRNVKLNIQPNGSSSWIARLLRASDRATFLYLRMATCRRAIFPWGAKCRA